MNLSSMLRKKALAGVVSSQRVAAGTCAIFLMAGLSRAGGWTPDATYNQQTGRVMLTNGRLELTVDTRSGLNPNSLRDTKTGRLYADADYRWPDHQFPKLTSAPAIEHEKDGSCSVKFTGALGPLTIVQTFEARGNEPNALREFIELSNASNAALDTSSFACGFGKQLCEKNCMRDDVAYDRFCNVPYRRSSETGELNDYTVQDLLTKPSWFSTGRTPDPPRAFSSTWGAEGWAWYQGDNTLLVSKYNSDALEWSLLFPERNGYANYVLRFGGAGRWKMGDPEGAIRLEPHSGFRFGMTRYEVLNGDWRAAYAANRRFTEQMGDRLPANYNPPVNWNELYDNPLWETLGDSVANRAAAYRVKDMKIAAESAHELGCECLYLDPGWDTEFGSTIWAADRLGTERSFVSWLKSAYGMSLGLHTPLAPWNSSSTYPPEARMLNQDGTPMGDLLCTASSAYIDTKVARLQELCKGGASFLMFDGSWYAGDGWYLDHGKITKLTHQKHVDAVLKIAQEVHASYPHVLIEQHDPMVGPAEVRYVPTYFMYDKPGGFNELWGFEFMNDPLNDVLSGRAVALYYLDLAYDIPAYLHTKLWRDNANALMFWWYASTCRHLGMGGKPTDPAVWEAEKQAMKTYLPLKRFYAQGDFYGLDETVHAHTLPDLRTSVIDCFNLSRDPVVRHIPFHLADIGLADGKVAIDGGSLTREGKNLEMTVSIPALGHQLVKITRGP